MTRATPMTQAGRVLFVAKDSGGSGVCVFPFFLMFSFTIGNATAVVLEKYMDIARFIAARTIAPSTGFETRIYLPKTETWFWLLVDRLSLFKQWTSGSSSILEAAMRAIGQHEPSCLLLLWCQ